MRHFVTCAAALAVAALLSACGGPAATIAVDADATVTSSSLDFNVRTFTLPADMASKIHFVNQSAMPHNIAIYMDSTATAALFVGQTVDSRDIVYDVPPLAAGTYYFRCDVHTDMNGTVFVGPVPTGAPTASALPQ